MRILALLRYLLRLATYRLSTKLSLIYVITIILTILISVNTISSILPEHPRKQLSERLSLYVFDSLEQKTTSEAFSEFARSLNVGLLVIGDDGVEFSTEAAFPDPALITSFVEQTATGHISMEFTHGGEDYFILMRDDKIYVLSDFVTGLSSFGRGMLIAGASSIILVLLISFLSVRYVIAPVRPLRKAVLEIGDGNLETRLNANRKDELGTLAHHINEMAEKLERSSKSKRDLLVAIGHEFSSPIARLLFQIERIEDDELRDKIRGNLMRMNSLFRTLISVEMVEERTSMPAAEGIPFPCFLEELVETIDLDVLELRTEGQSRNLNVDAMSLEILLSNMIDNARRYAAGSPILVDAKLDKNLLKIYVKDRGPGIRPDLIGEITEPFMREDKSRGFSTGGMGLGLYLCARIVKGCKGKIDIKNRKGGGLSIYIELPVRASQK